MGTTTNTKAELIETLQFHRHRILQFGVKQIGLFGSFVRNEVRQDSDIDLLIEFYPERKTFDNFMELAFYLEELLGRKVEIVTPQSLSKYIGPYILKEVEYVHLAA
jgi:uncharacterized protein